MNINLTLTNFNKEFEEKFEKEFKEYELNQLLKTIYQKCQIKKVENLIIKNQKEKLKKIILQNKKYKVNEVYSILVNLKNFELDASKNNALHLVLKYKKWEFLEEVLEAFKTKKEDINKKNIFEEKPIDFIKNDDILIKYIQNYI